MKIKTLIKELKKYPKDMKIKMTFIGELGRQYIDIKLIQRSTFFYGTPKECKEEDLVMLHAKQKNVIKTETSTTLIYDIKEDIKKKYIEFKKTETFPAIRTIEYFIEREFGYPIPDTDFIRAAIKREEIKIAECLKDLLEKGDLL